jgi:purine nucleoside permease
VIVLPGTNKSVLTPSTFRSEDKAILTMRSQLFAAFNLLSAASASLVPAAKVQPRALEYVVKPKVFIISMFDPEADIWYGIPEFDLLALNITVPGFSPLFPDAHCTADGDVCQLVTGESGRSIISQ